MNQLTHSDLNGIFDYLSLQNHKGMSGVTLINGKRPGETAVISMMTHGNEVSGLAAAYYLLREKDKISDRLKGRIALTLNNEAAGIQYFAAETEEEQRKARKFEMNMNRLPEDILDRTSSKEVYEIRRAHTLYPLWKDAQSGLDLHSTTLPSDPMLIDIKGDKKGLDDLSDGIPIRDRLENIVPVQIGYPVGSLYGGLSENIPVIEVESGCHHDPAAIVTAVNSAVAFLIKRGMLEGFEVEEKDDTQHVYRVTSSVKFPNLSYELSKIYRTFEPVQEGEIIARGDRKPIVSALEGHAIFGPDKLKRDDPKKLEEEVLFLTAKMRERARKLLVPDIRSF